jgi:hypothetical protein
MATDEFKIDLNLHHPSCDPEMITETLALKPWFAKENGAKVGDVTHKQTTWLCDFRRGTFDWDFATALEDVVTLLSKHEAFFAGFVGQGGEIELVLNSAVDASGAIGDKLLELSLHPWFLKQLGDRGISLRVQAWSAELKSSPA